MLTEAATTPDAQKSAAIWNTLTARWENPIPVKFRIRAFKENAQPQTGMFQPDWIDDAVSWIEDFNARLQICRPQPDQAGSVPASASDSDIVAAFFCGLTAATPPPPITSSASTARAAAQPCAPGQCRQPAFISIGRLEEPCTDLAAWREMQRTIAAHFGSDKSVINPSRIMRVAGTVAYPDRKKRERGYVSEITSCARTTRTSARR